MYKQNDENIVKLFEEHKRTEVNKAIILYAEFIEENGTLKQRSFNIFK